MSAAPGAIPVYVINLDRRSDRWEAISANLDRIGLRATRIAAIDGHALADDPALRLMGPGHVGCARSHIEAHRVFLTSPAPATLILEDDAELSNAVPAILRSLTWWPKGHGLIRMESSRSPERQHCLGHPAGSTLCGRALHPILRKHLGACAYLIDRETAKRTIAAAVDLPVPIDHMLFNMVDSAIARHARPLQMAPAAIRHRPFDLAGSDTADIRNRDLKDVFGRKPWKANELARLRYKARWMWLLMIGKAQNMKVPYRGISD